MPQFVKVVLITFLFGLISDGTYGSSDIQFRISGPELQKVASVLLKPRNDYIFNVTRSKVQGVSNNISYELTNLTELSKMPVKHVQISADDRMLITTFSDVLQQTGNLKLSRLSNVDYVIYEGPIDVSLFNVTITSSVFLDNSTQISTSNTLLPLDSSNCSVDVADISVNGKIMQNIGVEVSVSTLKKMFEMSICQTYNRHFSLALEESQISFDLFKKPITVGTVTSHVQIHNNYVIITQQVGIVSKGDNKLYPSDGPILPFPLPDSSSQPFEIILSTNVLNDLFQKFKKEIGLGVHDLPLGTLLPNMKSISELDTQGMQMTMLFPMVGKKYPDAVARMLVSDANIYITLIEGSVEIHFDINSTLSVSLNCDKNKTFNAFKFSMNLIFPAQIGFDNKYITLKLLSLGGNFTILESNVGHVMDRGLKSLLYSAPYFLSDQLHKLNDVFRGIPIQTILPQNIFAEVSLITVKGNHLIIGGNLSLTDPKLPETERKNIQWTGSHPKKDMILLGVDNTPENPKGFELKEENCKKKVDVHSSANQSFQTAFLKLMTIIASTSKLF